MLQHKEVVGSKRMSRTEPGAALKDENEMLKHSMLLQSDGLSDVLDLGENSSSSSSTGRDTVLSNAIIHLDGVVVNPAGYYYDTFLANITLYLFHPPNVFLPLPPSIIFCFTSYPISSAGIYYLFYHFSTPFLLVSLPFFFGFCFVSLCAKHISTARRRRSPTIDEA